MDDLISRQAAIDVLDVLRQEHRNKIPVTRETYSQYNEAWQDALVRAEGAIGNLPPAPAADAPEPKSPLYYGDGYSEGEMVYDSAECPNCGYIYDEGDNVWGEPYCSHCGQQLDWYMRGE